MVWQRLANGWKDRLEEMVDEVGLEDLEEKITGMLNAQLTRRVLLNLDVS